MCAFQFQRIIKNESLWNNHLFSFSTWLKMIFILLLYGYFDQYYKWAAGSDPVCCSLVNHPKPDWQLWDQRIIYCSFHSYYFEFCSYFVCTGTEKMFFKQKARTFLCVLLSKMNTWKIELYKVWKIIL